MTFLFTMGSTVFSTRGPGVSLRLGVRCGSTRRLQVGTRSPRRRKSGLACERRDASLAEAMISFAPDIEVAVADFVELSVISHCALKWRSGLSLEVAADVKAAIRKCPGRRNRRVVDVQRGEMAREEVIEGEGAEKGATTPHHSSSYR